MSNTILVDIWTVLARRRSINIIGPILDLCRALHALFICFPFEVPDPPGKKPGEHDGHDETDGDDSDNEDEGEVEDDGGGDAANTVCVYEADRNEVL